MNAVKKQSGLSMVGILFLIIVFGFALLFAATVVPSYINDRAAVASLKQLADEPNLSDMSLADVRSRLQKSLSLNSVNDVARDALKVKRKGAGKKGYLATIEYEHRDNLFLNIDLVVRYHSVLDTKAPELCCDPQ